MPLPAPQARTHLHTRAVVYRGYQREDGLWDIEAEMTDTKTYTLDRSERGDMPPGTPIHGMAIRATVDDNMTIREIASSSDHAFPADTARCDREIRTGNSDGSVATPNTSLFFSASVLRRGVSVRHAAHEGLKK